MGKSFVWSDSPCHLGITDPQGLQWWHGLVLNHVESYFTQMVYFMELCLPDVLKVATDSESYVCELNQRQKNKDECWVQSCPNQDRLEQMSSEAKQILIYRNWNVLSSYNKAVPPGLNPKNLIGYMLDEPCSPCSIPWKKNYTCSSPSIIQQVLTQSPFEMLILKENSMMRSILMKRLHFSNLIEPKFVFNFVKHSKMSLLCG